MAALRNATVEVVDRLRSELGEDRYRHHHDIGAGRPVEDVMNGARGALLAIG